MNPDDETCSCQLKWVGRLHLCAVACPVLEHSTDELDYAFAICQTELLQLRLF